MAVCVICHSLSSLICRLHSPTPVSHMLYDPPYYIRPNLKPWAGNKVSITDNQLRLLHVKMSNTFCNQPCSCFVRGSVCGMGCRMGLLLATHFSHSQCPQNEVRLAAQQRPAHFSANLICRARGLNFGHVWCQWERGFDEVDTDTWYNDTDIVTMAMPLLPGHPDNQPLPHPYRQDVFYPWTASRHAIIANP